MKVAGLYDAISNCDAEIIVLQGGTWSAKTYSTLQYLAQKAATQKDLTITIVGQDMPNLKVGAIRQLAEIISSEPAFVAEVEKHNKSENSYLFKSGSLIEFKSYENWQDAKSGKRTHLFVNEANGEQWEVVKQLMIRTTVQTIIDFNPDAEFWAHEHLKGNPKARWFYSDHRHNPFVPAKVREEIEALKDVDLELWKVYARGMTGRIEGLVYRHWDIVEHWPSNIVDSCYGLDFGYNHPTALVEVAWTDSTYYVRELIYESALTTPALIERMKTLGIKSSKQIWADAARPDAIEEIKLAGFASIRAADKSVKDGISSTKAKPLKIYQSPGIVKEIRAYRWKTDANGKPLDEPVKVNDDGMDAMRYAIYNGAAKPKKTYKW
jgi:phage terminase large subunit